MSEIKTLSVKNIGHRRTIMNKFGFYIILVLAVLIAAPAYAGGVAKVRVEMAIGPIAQRVIENSIDRAEEEDRELLIIELDTPGGLNESMRGICRALLNCDIPVVVYVAPSGAHAASAGVFVTYSAHIAAMAPGTNIGAAHVVNMGGEMDSVMTDKVQNDAVAYITSIAKQRNRNITWAESAVRESKSIDAETALDSNVIDLIAIDIDELLSLLQGWEVELDDRTVVMNVEGETVTEYDIGFKNRFLNIITNPSLAFILFNLGWLGLMIELYNPGSVLPGVVGGICLILAFFAFQQLPINYAGLALIILAVVFFVLEVKVVSHGVLAIGGIVSMLLGSLLLIDSPEPYLQISLVVIITTVVVISAFFLFVISFAIKAHRRKVITGREGIIGAVGKMRGNKVFVEGELWRAECDEPLIDGDKVKVKGIENMRLKVIKQGGDK
ncbi:MAG: nodulation protein NfeD [candidate division Zixibacteria bacterium]|nr:nodulation protein NfeD [candidate division Zixibacteria bacterium]